ncbi:MAG: Saccharopine dehydrogenase [Chaenotheca gracillima]|nr:MAG: Saccharopine dehydrogenase [Chaenotheca gracillima]
MGSLPKTFKAAVFESQGAPLTIKEITLQPPKEGEVLVKVIASGVCGSDAHVQAGAFGNAFPITPGHEIVGQVAAVGPGEKQWKVGERVGGPWHGGHDGTCKQCRRGQYQMCSNASINGVTRDGGFAEYVILSTEAVVSVPEDIDPAQAAPLLCAGVTVFNAIRKMDILHGGIVAVQGLGGLGHLAIQYANKMGYRVVAISSSAAKEDFAKKLGAHDYINTAKEDAAEKLQALGGAALVVCTASNPDAMGGFLGGLEAGGKLLILAPAGETKVNTIAMITKGLSVHGWPSGHSLDCEEAIEFAQVHDVNCMIEKFPLKDAQKAFERMTSGNVRFRSVLVVE